MVTAREPLLPKTQRILLAVGDAAARESLASELRRRKLDVTVARDGQEALEKARDLSPDHVVVELNLSRLSGLDVWRGLKGKAVTVLVDAGDARGEADLKRLKVDHVVKRSDPAETAMELRLRLPPADPDRDLMADMAKEDKKVRDRSKLVELAGGERELLEQAILDPTTRLHSAAYLRRRLEEEWARSRALGSIGALALLGPDFEGRTDGGRDLLKLEQDWSGKLLGEAPPQDLMFRDGPCRLAVLFPCADRASAERHAVELRRLLMEDGPVSAGLAVFPHKLFGSWEEALARAGEALRAAQALGGGRVCVWEGVREVPEDGLSGSS